MAYSIDQDQIIQEVTLAAEFHPQLATASNKENLLITLCNYYDAYDQIHPVADLINWTVISRADYDALNVHPQYDIGDQTQIFQDGDQVMIHNLRKTLEGIGINIPEIAPKDFIYNYVDEDGDQISTTADEARADVADLYHCCAMATEDDKEYYSCRYDDAIALRNAVELAFLGW